VYARGEWRDGALLGSVSEKQREMGGRGTGSPSERVEAGEQCRRSRSSKEALGAAGRGGAREAGSMGSGAGSPPPWREVGAGTGVQILVSVQTSRR
jgi:hypothetical protein